MSFYDIRLICPDSLSHDCYNFSLAPIFMQQPWIRELINVGQHQWYDREVEIAVSMIVDDERSFEYDVPTILAASVRALVYSGEYDFAANYVGGEMWAQSMVWPGQKAFNSTIATEWNSSNGTTLGWVRSVDGFTFLKLRNAGHMVPMNIPDVALSMVQMFMSGVPFSYK